MRTFPVILFFLILKTVQANDGYPRNEAIDILHYKCQLELNDSTDQIAGETEITIRFKKNVMDFEIDLASINDQGKGMTVKEILSGDSPLKFIHQNNRLKISLTANEGEEKKIIIRYSGIPANGLIIGKNKFGDRTFFADNWPDRAHHWFPSLDHPYDKATCEFIVTAPEQYSVIGTGVKVEESSMDKKRKLTHWKTSVILPTKVMVIGVARFAVEYTALIDGIPVQSWVYPQNRKEGFSDYSVTGKIMDFFVRNIAPFPYEKLAGVQSTTAYGGMENAGNIFYYERSVTGRNMIEGLVAHEVAHQWFGDSASEADWHHVWLSEGFATYMTNLYFEKTYGRDRLMEEMKADRRQVIDFTAKSPAPVVNTAITEYRKVLSVNTYQKASWVLHMLRHEIGDQKFWEGIRQYYRQYQLSNAWTDDFRMVMEKVSGKDLKSFFNQWIFQTGNPTLEVTWKYDARKKQIRLNVVQQQATTFSFPLEIGLQLAGGKSAREKILVSERKKEFLIPLDEKPASIELDPDTWLLFSANVKETP